MLTRPHFLSLGLSLPFPHEAQFLQAGRELASGLGSDRPSFDDERPQAQGADSAIH